MQSAWDGHHSAGELPRAEVLEALSRARDIDSSVRDQPPETLLRKLWQECSLLVTADQQAWSFAHLTFQEYLAFRHGRKKAEELALRSTEPRWRELILLGMSDPDFQPAFFAALLCKPGALAALPPHLLQAALLEKRSPADLVAEPWLAFFNEAATAQCALAPSAPWWGWWRWLKQLLGVQPKGPPIDDLLAALGIFRSDATQVLIEAADRLSAHPNELVREAAARVGGREPVVVAPAAEPQAGDLRFLTLPGGLKLAVVWVPGGDFWMGATSETDLEVRNYDPKARDNEAPVHLVSVAGFWMGQHPVTNAQYRAFVKANSRPEPDCWRRKGLEGDEQPVTTVDHTDATAFCTWLAAESGAPVCLPTEAQWERAARGDDGRKYPWGNEDPTPERAVFDKQPLAIVGGRPAGRSPYGAHDMAGQVWEWTTSIGRPYQAHADPFLWGDDRSLQSSSGADPGAVRGGSWFGPVGILRAAYRGRWLPSRRSDAHGFRVCVLREPIP